MRICYLANVESAYASPHTIKWLRYFVKKGHEVFVLTFHPGEVDGVSVFHLKIKAPFKLGYVTAKSQVSRLIRHIKPDILHSHYMSGYGTLGRLSKFHPYVLSVWGSDIFVFPRKSPIHAWLIRKNLRAADVICSTSRIMAEEIRKYLHTDKTIRVTPFGVDIDLFSPKRHARKRDILTIGTVKALKPHYGIDILVKAFSIVNLQFRSRRLRLIIIGEGPQRDYLRDLVKHLGLEKQTEFVGPVDPKKVPSYLHQMDVFVAPSRRESFGVALLEASGCGLPVISSCIGGIPEVVKDGETGILVPPEDTESVAKAILKLIKDEKLRKRMGNAGRDFVLEHYNWEKNAMIIEEIYDEITS